MLKPSSALVAGVLGAVAMGSAAPALKMLGSTALSPVNVIQVRVALGALALAVAAVALRRRVRVPRAQWPLIAAYGVVTIAANQVLYVAALGRLPVGVALLLEYLAPVLVALWVRFVRGRPASGALWAGIGVLLVGVALVGGSGTGPLDAVGVLFGLLAAVTMAGRFLLAERGLRDHDPLVLAMWGASCGAVALLVVRPFPVAVLADVVDGVPVWALALYAGLVGLALAVLLGVVAQRGLAPTAASSVAAVEVVVGGVVAAVVLGERLGAAQWVGVAAVLAGVALAQVGARRDQATLACSAANPATNASSASSKLSASIASAFSRSR
ncbi:EamA family transporter [Actinokineospora sp. G85]|uniref:EamA family transporter n=1 Tax=Actinokineospora sp. G85 TaxID=3406626 RepID=UPI003C72715C